MTILTFKNTHFHIPKHVAYSYWWDIKGKH